MEVTGKITKTTKLRRGTTKEGKEWESMDFILESQDGEYVNKYCFGLFNEKLNDFKKYNKIGDHVKVSFNIRTTEHNQNYYTNLSPWRIEKIQEEQNASIGDLSF